MTMQDEALKLAIEKAGGMRALGRALGVNYQTFQVWKKIPAGRVVAIEKITKIPREKLRPDLYSYTDLFAKAEPGTGKTKATNRKMRAAAEKTFIDGSVLVFISHGDADDIGALIAAYASPQKAKAISSAISAQLKKKLGKSRLR